MLILAVPRVLYGTFIYFQPIIITAILYFVPLLKPY